MNALDVFLLVIIGGALVYGLWKGFVRIALGVAGFGFGLALAFRLADRGPRWFGSVFSSATLARFVAFFVVLVGALIVTGLVAWLAGKALSAVGLSWMDRLAGAVVGLAGGLLVSIGVLLALTSFLPPGSSLLRGSRLAPIAIGGVDLAAAVLPPEMSAAYRERRDALSWRSEAITPPASTPPPRGKLPS